MIPDKDRPLQKAEKSKNAAENIESDLMVNAPDFDVSAQLKSEPKATTSKSKPYQLKTQNSSSTVMPDGVKDKMESSFGADFSDVKIHSHSAEAKNLGAQAFAKGNDVHFAPGKYNPESRQGQELLGHELTHVVQQREGKVQATEQKNGTNINSDKSLEAEADKMGANAADPKGAPIQQKPTAMNTSSDVAQLHPGHEEEEHQNEHEGSTPETNSNQNEGESESGSMFGGIFDPISDVISDIELALFNMQDNWGPRSLVPPIFSQQAGYGGFEASYNRPGRTLNVTVRGKTRFTNGLSDNGGSITSNQEDLDQLANVLNIMGDSTLNSNVVSAYTWTDEGKEGAKEQFKARLAESIGIWENSGLEFYVNKPGWEDITANLNVNLNVEEEGSLGDTASREAAGQHQQINIYKTPNDGERSTIRSQVNAAIQNYESTNNMSIGRVNSYDVRAYVDGEDDGSGYADTNAHNGSMHLSSNDLGNSQRNDDSSMLSSKVWFDHDSDALKPHYEQRIKNFIQRFKGDGDANLDNNGITLIGHTSSSGTEEYNQGLAQRRINAVKAVLAGEGITKFNERTKEDNQGENAHNGNPDGNEAYYRSVDIKIGSGEVQNTVAHEFGHVFGLADEYEEGSRSPGDASGHNRLSNEVGTGDALVENNDGIISMGNEVRAQHYSVFAWALRELTGKPWTVREQ